MRIFVAFGGDTNPKTVEIEGKKGKTKEVKIPKRIARNGLTPIKKAMAEYPNTEWSVAFYNIKPDAATLCAIIESIASIEAEEVTEFRINGSGQVRKVG